MNPSVYHYFASYATNSGEAQVDGLARVSRPIVDNDQYAALKSMIAAAHGIPKEADIRVRSLALLGDGTL